MRLCEGAAAQYGIRTGSWSWSRSRSRSRSSRPCHHDRKMFVFITILIVNACIAGTLPATPENITVTFLNPTTVRVSWQTMIDLNAHPVDKYIVTYKPTDDRVVRDIAGNSEAIILDRLSPSTQYSIAVTAIWLGKKYRSRQIIFRTLDLPKQSSQQELANSAGLGSGAYSGNNNLGAMNFGRGANEGNGSGNGSGIYGDDGTSTVANTFPHGKQRELPTIRGVEIGIVLIVLMVWAGAIALFFNRWGKIRMLLPYQPDFKNEQLKVPGTGVCNATACSGQHSHQIFQGNENVVLLHRRLEFDSSELHRFNSRNFQMLREERSTSISERCTRSRINSAIFVSSEGRGFDSIEFLRRHGSQSVLCRKARSAENITDNDRKKSFSEQRQWRTSEEPASRESNTAGDIELKECRSGTEARVLSVLNSNAEPATAATNAANLIVGSISIEAPPSNIFDDTHSLKSVKAPTAHASIASTASASHDSADTVEELIQISTTAAAATATATAAAATPTIPKITSPLTTLERKSRVLVRQRSSTASQIGLRSQSPATSVFVNPKPLTLKSVMPKVIANLPMVSVSGPSPQEEKPECL